MENDQLTGNISPKNHGYSKKSNLNINVEKQYSDLIENLSEKRTESTSMNQEVSQSSKSVSHNPEMFDYNDFFQVKIDSKKKDGSYRNFKKIIRKAKLFPEVQEKQEMSKKNVTIWCSNDYLGLGRHPYVQSEVCRAVETYGVGSGGTRNISGSNPLHEKLEFELARYD